MENSVITEFSKLGPFAVLAGLVLWGMARGLVFLFKKYDEAQTKRIELSEKTLTTIAANTTSNNNLTAAINILGEKIVQRINSDNKGP